MSGLVAYESSSDEEAAEVDRSMAETAPPGRPFPQNDSSKQDGTPVPSSLGKDVLRESVSAKDLNGPVLGPATPTDGDNGEETTSPALADNMSERDAIRYQTQAPVPMMSMPPSPPGSPNPEANTRFARFAMLKANGVHFNEDLVQKTSFLNPGLLATMMTRAGIEDGQQYNTALPHDLWNPQGFPSWAYKEELLKSQQDIRDRRDAETKSLSAAGKRMIPFASAGDTSNESSRRSTPGLQRKRRMQ